MTNSIFSFAILGLCIRTIVASKTADIGTSYDDTNSPDIRSNQDQIFSYDKSSVDLRKFMPPAQYSPRAQRHDENLPQYQDRITLGKQRFEARQRRLEGELQKVLDQNVDPCTLEKEMHAAIMSYKGNLKEKRRAYNSELEEAGTSREEFESPFNTSMNKEHILKQVLDKRRRQSYASRFRRRYREASDAEKEAIIVEAAHAGFSLDDLTRRKFSPSIYERMVHFAGYTTDAQEDEVQISRESEHDELSQPMLVDANDLPADWLSLGQP